MTICFPVTIGGGDGDTGDEDTPQEVIPSETTQVNLSKPIIFKDEKGTERLKISSIQSETDGDGNLTSINLDITPVQDGEATSVHTKTNIMSGRSFASYPAQGDIDASIQQNTDGTVTKILSFTPNLSGDLRTRIEITGNQFKASIQAPLLAKGQFKNVLESKWKPNTDGEPIPDYFIKANTIISGSLDQLLTDGSVALISDRDWETFLN